MLRLFAADRIGAAVILLPLRGIFQFLPRPSASVLGADGLDGGCLGDLSFLELLFRWNGLFGCCLSSPCDPPLRGCVLGLVCLVFCGFVVWVCVWCVWCFVVWVCVLGLCFGWNGLFGCCLSSPCDPPSGGCGCLGDLSCLELLFYVEW